MFGILAVICAKAPVIPTSVLFHYLCKFPHSKKGKRHCSVIMKIILPSWIPGRFWGTLGVHWVYFKKANILGTFHLATPFLLVSTLTFNTNCNHQLIQSLNNFGRKYFSHLPSSSLYNPTLNRVPLWYL